MKIAICDEDILFANKLNNQLLKMNHIGKIDLYHEMKSVNLMREQKYDVVFMGIDWNNEITGIDLAALLYDGESSTRIVFMTSHIMRFVERLYDKRSNIAGILKKPINETSLWNTIDRIFEEIQDDVRNTLQLKEKETNRLVKIRLSEILYIENMDHYQLFCTTSETIAVFGRMKSWEQQLPDNFIRCHKGFIVNMKHIDNQTNSEIVLNDGKKISIGRTYGHYFREKYTQFVAGKC